MASIPVADIPNAPQQVSAPVADAHFAGDQVGGQAINEINRSFDSMKVNPLAAAVGGEMMMKSAQQLTQASQSVGEGIGHLAMMQNQKDYASGQIKFYQNKLQLDQQFQDATLGQPIEQHPVIYNQIYGENGANMYQGMTDREKLWQHMDVQHNYMTGMSTQVNAVGNFHQQQLQTQAMINFDNALQSGRLDDAVTINETMGKSGWFPPAHMAQNQKLIDNKTDVFGITNDVNANPIGNDWADKLTRAYASDSPVEGYPNLSQNDKRNLANFVEIKRNDAESNITSPLMAQIDAYKITDPKILMEDPGFKQLRPDKQDALMQRLKSDSIGTPIGIANTLHGQQLIDMYPQATTPEGKIKELDEIQNYITANVPGDQAKVQQKALMDLRSNYAATGGNPDQDKIVTAFGSQYLETAKKGGAFGKLPTADELKTAPGADKMLQIEQRIADIKQKIQGGYDYGNGKRPITTPSEMKKILSELMHAEEVSKITPQMHETLKDSIKRNLSYRNTDNIDTTQDSSISLH